MTSHRRKRLVISAVLCALVVVCAFLGIFLADRRRAAEQAAEAESERQYLQYMADLEAHYFENQAAYQLIFDAFREDAALESITRSNPEEYSLSDGERYWMDFRSKNLPLFQALETLDRTETPWLYFIRWSEPDQTETMVRCDLPPEIHWSACWTSPHLLLSDTEPEREAAAVYWKQLDEHCWLAAEIHGMAY